MPILPTATPFDPHPRYPTAGWMFNTLAELNALPPNLGPINDTAARKRMAAALVALGFDVTADAPPATIADDAVGKNGDGR